MDEDVKTLIAGEPLAIQLLTLMIVLMMGGLAGLGLAACLSASGVDALLAAVAG